MFSILFQVHSQREDSYVKLQKHRQNLKEDKHILMEHEREHTRLLRIGAKTDISTEAYWEYNYHWLFEKIGYILPKFLCDNSVVIQVFCLHCLRDCSPKVSVEAGSPKCFATRCRVIFMFNRCMKTFEMFVLPFHPLHVWISCNFELIVIRKCINTVSISWDLWEEL